MVHLYAADIGSLPDPKEAPALLQELDIERKCRIMKYLKAEDRKRSLGAGLLLNGVLPRYGASPDAVRAGADGKPEVEGIFFNLSHSGSVVICATAEKEVGCDVEKNRESAGGSGRAFFSHRRIRVCQCMHGRGERPQVYPDLDNERKLYQDDRGRDAPCL